MEPLPIILTVVGLLLAPLVLMSLGLQAAVNAMNNPRLKLRKASKKIHRDKFAAAAEHHEWAKANGFKWVGAFVIKAPQELFIACWQQPNAPRYFCIYTNAQADYYDFATLYRDDWSLTTSGSKDAHTLPFPEGKWVQSYHEADHETLWDRHREAEAYLERAHDTVLAQPRDDFPTVVVDAIHAQMKYVRSIPLWQVRGVLWYLLRGRKSGRSIEEQDA